MLSIPSVYQYSQTHTRHVAVQSSILIYSWNTKYGELHHICWNDNISWEKSDCRQTASYCTDITPTNRRRIRKLRAIFTCKICCKTNCIAILAMMTSWKKEHSGCTVFSFTSTTSKCKEKKKKVTNQLCCTENEKHTKTPRNRILLEKSIFDN